MPEDDEQKRRLEEARREMGEDEEPASLRVVPLYPEPWRAADWVPTGEALVREFMRKHGEDFYWVEDEGVYYHWTGHVWERDQCRLVPRLMAQLCRDIAGVKSKKALKSKLEGSAFINGATGHVRDWTAGPFERFDQMPILNTPDASILMNCAKLEPRTQQREDFCTKMTAVPWIKDNRKCQLWLAFLNRITEHDGDLQAYLARLFGYCASPYTSEQALAFFYGTGANGKTTLLNVIARLLGSYAQHASLDLFLATRFEQHPEELAQLRAKRLVIATETEEGRHWNEAKIKALTGGDMIRARLMRQNSFEFKPLFKIIIGGNYQPGLKHVGPAMRRRLQLLPFNIEIPREEQVADLEDKLIETEGPAILGWILAGFEQWREHGLSPPDRVVNASIEYFEEQDLPSQWIKTCNTTKLPDGSMRKGFVLRLFARYSDFCKQANVRPGDVKSFVTMMKNKGFEHDHTKDGRVFWGIDVISEWDDDQFGR